MLFAHSQRAHYVLMKAVPVLFWGSLVLKVLLAECQFRKPQENALLVFTMLFYDGNLFTSLYIFFSS